MSAYYLCLYYIPSRSFLFIIFLYVFYTYTYTYFSITLSYIKNVVDDGPPPANPVGASELTTDILVELLNVP